LGGGHGEEGCCRGDNGGLHFECLGLIDFAEDRRFVLG
jgi:hypothetical protein